MRFHCAVVFGQFNDLALRLIHEGSNIVQFTLHKKKTFQLSGLEYFTTGSASYEWVSYATPPNKDNGPLFADFWSGNVSQSQMPSFL